MEGDAEERHFFLYIWGIGPVSEGVGCMGDCSRAYSEKENMYAISFKHRSCFCLVKLFNSPHTTTTKLNWRVFDKGGYQLSSLVAIVGPRSRSGITRGWTPAPLHLPGPERQIKILPHTTTHRLPSRNRSPTKTTSRVVHRPANERVCFRCFTASKIWGNPFAGSALFVHFRLHRFEPLRTYGTTKTGIKLYPFPAVNRSPSASGRCRHGDEGPGEAAIDPIDKPF